MSENRLDDVEKKIDALQYKEINPLKEDVNDIKVNLAENNVLTKQAIETSDKLSDTMMTLRETMVEICTSMKASNKTSEELADNVKKLSSQVVTLDRKVEDKFTEVDDKSKVDILKWITDNWLSVILAIGAFGYIITQTIK